MLTNREIKEKGLYLEYDAQSLFNYHIYCKNKMCINNFNILGLNYKKNNILKSKYYPEKDIHIVSFTFYTLQQILNLPIFKEKFNYMLKI